MRARLIVAVAILATFFLLSGCALEGLHRANPYTEIEAGPFKVYNSKDVEFQGLEGEYDPDTGHVKLKVDKASDMASSVREANAKQILASAEEARVAWGGINKLTGQLIGALGILQAQAQEPTLNRQAIVRDVVMEVLHELRAATTQPVP